ncbi:MAG: FKBP-type peptidyl-prolyl cis-trans isomerase [Flavobacteriales bacterium]
MKNYVTIAAALIMSAVVFAQKPTMEKQDEMLKAQTEMSNKMDQLLSEQAAIKSLYGSNLDLSNEVTKFSYAYGLSLGENFKTQGIGAVDFIAFNKGLLDALQNMQPKMSAEEAQQFLNTYIGNLMAMKAQMAKEEGQKWLNENGKRKGVVTTESGLQYEVLKAGTGEKPVATSKVTVHYHGTLRNGEVFDSSVQRGQPASFGLNQVIKGWTEGVQLMPVGSKYKFYIPSELGYGERGAGGAIGPNEVLVFEVELISIDK